jgi:Leucine rich repeat
MKNCVAFWFVLAAAAAVVPQLTSGVPFECVFGKDSDKRYQCVNFNLVMSKKNSSIDKIVGTHIKGTTNVHVSTVTILSQKVWFFPCQIFKHFANLNNFIYNSDKMVNSGLYETIERGNFNGAKKLKKVVLTGHEFPQLKCNVFEGAENLTHIILYENGISDIAGGAFRKLQKLTYLDLSQNSLTSLHTKLFSELVQLTHLYLRGNSQFLDLSRNYLKIIATDLLQKLPAIQILEFKSNLCINQIFKNDSMTSFSQYVVQCSEGSSLEEQLKIESEKNFNLQSKNKVCSLAAARCAQSQAKITNLINKSSESQNNCKKLKAAFSKMTLEVNRSNREDVQVEWVEIECATDNANREYSNNDEEEAE